MRKTKILLCLLPLLLLPLGGCDFFSTLAEREIAAEPPAVKAEGPNTPESAGAPAESVFLPEEAAEPEAPPPEAPPEEAEEPEEAGAREFVLSFAGDCTLGTNYDTYGSEGSFVRVVGEDYDYPFHYARHYFLDDDLTLVNLEGALTDYDVPQEKEYRFRGPPAYAKILSESGVECASLANNHSGDFGSRGLSDTRAALEAEGVAYIDDNGTLLYETDRGLTVGICAYFYGASGIERDIRALRDAGAQLVIAACHYGEEGSYTVTDDQIWLSHLAIDAGADLVVGTHPHVLQRIEEYHGGIICYSLGNFSFGGNINPRDKDTVILRQHVTLTEEGQVILGETEPVPFRLSSVSGYNNYQPMPYEEGSEEYERVLAKLNGSFVPDSE